MRDSDVGKQNILQMGYNLLIQFRYVVCAKWLYSEEPKLSSKPMLVILVTLFEYFPSSKHCQFYSKIFINMTRVL